jgi:hypothetical protein
MRSLLVLLIAVPLFAETEICRFRAGDRDDPFRRWLASSEVTCGAANAPLPEGLWNVFARGGGTLSRPLLFEGTVDPTLLPLNPAAMLTVKLPEKHGGVVYAPRLASAYPITGERMLVPAAEELWVLVLEPSRAIASIVPVPAIEAGTERAVDGRIGALPASVIGWVHIDEKDREALAKATGTELPIARIGARQSDPLPPLSLLHGAFVLVRGVNAGEAQLDIGGRGWLPHRTSVKVGTRMVTTAKDPLRARPSASLIVNWTTGMDNIAALERELGSCDPFHQPPARFEIVISACAKPKRGGNEVDPATCREIRREISGTEKTYGAFTVDDIAPGTYRGELRFGKLPPISTTVQAVALQQRQMRLHMVYETLYGSVTRGGEPLEREAWLEFPDGVGFWSAKRGEYRAVLRSMPEADQKVDVETCNGRLRAFVITDEDARPRTRYDLDVPISTITFDVTDTFTHLRLLTPVIKYKIMSELYPRRVLVEDTLKIDEEKERQVLEGVPERPIRITVSHPGYQKIEIPEFTVAKREQKVLDVQMMPLRGSHGRIVSPLPFENGSITWMSAIGTEVEHVELAADGTFVYEQAHEPGEIMAIVSSSHPLWVLRSPVVAARQNMEIVFPEMPRREFEVSVKNGDNRVARHIGIVVGGLLVPHTALRAHQSLREERSVVFGNLSMTLRDIGETGPIDVLYGPTVNEVPSRGRGFDPLMLPRATEAPRVRLTPGQTEVVFEGQ